MKKTILTAGIALALLVAAVIAVNKLMFFGTPFDFAETSKVAGVVTFDSPYTGKEENIVVAACNPAKGQPAEDTIFVGINLNETESDEVYLFYHTSQPAADDFQIVKCWTVVNTNDTKLIQSMVNITFYQLWLQNIEVTSDTAYE